MNLEKGIKFLDNKNIEMLKHASIALVNDDLILHRMLLQEARIYGTLAQFLRVLQA